MRLCSNHVAKTRCQPAASICVEVSLSLTIYNVVSPSQTLTATFVNQSLALQACGLHRYPYLDLPDTNETSIGSKDLKSCCTLCSLSHTIYKLCTWCGHPKMSSGRRQLGPGFRSRSMCRQYSAVFFPLAINLVSAKTDTRIDG